MKNKILIAAFAAAACVSVGSSEGLLLGIEGDYSFKSSVKGKTISYGDKFKWDDAQPAIGIKIGYDFDVFRVYGAYSYDFEASKSHEIDMFSWKDSWKKHNLLVGADFTPEITNSFKLIAGAYTGVSFMRYKNESSFSLPGYAFSVSYKANLNGWVIGAKLGGLYSLDEHNEIEFGYKADYTKYGKTSDEKDMKDVRETNHGIYLGYNFKF